MSSRSSSMVRHSIRMMAGTLVSRILGLIREVLIASLFGATGKLDAFLVAYTLANLTRRLLAEGALSAAFVPVFSQLLKKEGKSRAFVLASQVLSILMVASISIILLGVFFAPTLVSILAPGFASLHSALASQLTVLMLPFLLFISVAALAMGILNSLGCFFVPAVAPALSNVVFIILVVILAPKMEIYSLAWAVLAGGLAQCALQWFWIKRWGFTLLPARPDMKDDSLKRTLCLFLPYAAGLSITQLIPVFSRVLGSFLQEGSISVLNYADRVLQLPLGLFIIAISQAVLPLFAHLAMEDEASFKKGIEEALQFAIFIVAPVVIGMVMLNREIVHFLFFRGAFSAWAWGGTSLALMLFVLGLPGTSCLTVLMRAFYAKGYSREPLILSAFSVVLYVAFGVLLMKPYSYGGLAAASSVSFTLTAILGGALLDKRHIKVRPFSFLWLAKIVPSLALMAGTVYFLKELWGYPFSGAFIYKTLWMLSVISAGALSYGAATWIAGCREWKWVIEALGKKESKSGEK